MSSGKIHKYLTGEEILPSNQKQIKEKANFIYSPFIKAFQKQTKPTECQGQKQIKTFKDNKIKLANINSNDYTKELLILKERAIFKNLVNNKLDKREELANKVNCNWK